MGYDLRNLGNNSITEQYFRANVRHLYDGSSDNG